MKVGILALQGAFVEHVSPFTQLGTETVLVRLPDELDDLDGLVIPGGESTTIGKLIRDYGLAEPIKKAASKGFPILGICAGMILLAKKVIGLDFESLGIIGIEVKRNAYGRQIDSFETDLSIPVLGKEAFPGIFIRAPIIKMAEPEVEILCQGPNLIPVAVRQGKILACAFHPELTSDLRFHRCFLDLISGDGLCKD